VSLPRPDADLRSLLQLPTRHGPTSERSLIYAGTTHVLFEPTEFLERLAVLMPRPRVNLVLYCGVLAPRAACRQHVVAARHVHEGAGTETPADPPARSWAALMRRAFGFDVLACPRCGRAMRLIALIETGDVSRRILHHLGEATEVPMPAPARPPPQTYEYDQGASASSAETDAADARLQEPMFDDPR
jgi:hypothetical protein